jgi:CheY-like chemotaxis protein
LPTVLIIDEDGWARGELERALLAEPRLASVGLAIEVAEDAATALASFRLGRPDLAVINLTLPDEPGDVLAAALRREADRAALPIVFISSAAPDRAEIARLASAFDARHFTKPHGIAALVGHIGQTLVGGGAPAASAGAPRGSATVAPATEGDLASRPLPAVMFDLFEAEETGRLALRRGKVAKEILLIDGHPHGVASNVRTETLGHFLVGRRVIDGDQHGAAVAWANDHGQKFGEALVALGLISPEQLLAELGAQARFKLERTLRWRDGDWRFAPLAQVSGARGDAIDLVTAVFDGLRATLSFDPLPSHLALIAGRRIGLKGRAIRLLAAMHERYPGFVARCKDGETVESLVAAGVDRSEVLAALDVLVLSDAVTLASPTAKVAESPAAPPSIEALQRARRPSTIAPSFTPQRTRRTSSLGLGPSGGPGAAHRPGGARVIGAAAEPGAPDPMLRDDSGVLIIPEAARAVLDQGARQRLITEYLRVQGLDLYGVIEVARDAAPPVVFAAAMAKLQAYSRTLGSEAELGKDYGKLAELEALYRRALAVLGDPAERTAYDALLVPIERAAGPTPMAIELKVRESDRAAKAGDLAGAIAKLEEVIAAVPSEASYRAAMAHLVWQRAPGDPAVRAAALGHLDQALALDPDHAAGHEIRGVILAAAGDPAGAAHLLRALELDPTSPTALAALERELRARGELVALEGTYRQLLYRLDQRDPAFTVDLWRRLAALYRDDLGDLVRACAALATALELAPGDAELRAALADVESGATDRFHQRILELRGRVAAEPAAALALVQAADEAGKPDLGFLAAAVAVASGEAATTLVDRHGRFRPRFLRRACAPLDPSQRGRLAHPDDTAAMTRLFALLAGPARAVWPITLGDLEAAAPSADAALPDTLVKTRDYVAQLLEVAAPPVIVHPPLGASMAIAAVEPPALLVGDLSPERDRVELAFRIGRAMSYLTPGRAIAGAYPGRLLKQLVLAAHLAIHDLEPDPSAGDGLPSLVAAIKRLAAEPRAELAEVLRTVTREQRTLNLSQWTRALGWTADRVGLLVAGDPAVALAVTAAGSGREALAQLTEFALGPDHLELRAALGLSIDV